MSVKAEDITWKIGSRTILEQVSLEARPGEMLGLLGPNGSGKTSLLRLLAGLRQPHSGRVLLDNRDIRSLSRRSVATRVAFVEQHATTTSNMTVTEVVSLGRFPHRSMFSGWTNEDETAVDEALLRAGMVQKRHERWHSLSGGERQRAHIARALAQSPTELILDEPTNHLDIQHQIALMTLISSLPITSIIALHDLNHAAMFCDRLVVLEQGQVVAAGTPEEVLSEALLREVFRTETRVEASPHHGRPHIHFLRPGASVS